MNMPLSGKVTSWHLGRKAIVYLRQSSMKQVRQNLESQRLQYALADRAKEMGFAQVEVIDRDLGCSAAAGAAPREGFALLVASVAMGEVGMVLSREASRLSRSDRDWCHLLEVCQLFGTLLGDGEQIYDPRLPDDQLVLGIKGTLSVAELSILRARLVRGQEEKARRGELEKLLPPGYVWEEPGRVVMDPDGRVREAMERVFRKFRELRSVRQTFLWFRGEEVELPVNKSRGGRLSITWQLPTLAFVNSVLHNPFYAGAYVYGKRQTQPTLVAGRVVKRVGRPRRPEECRVCLRDHHPGYLDWQQFEENLRIMRGNNLKVERDEAVAAVRAGQGLLVGLLRCGRCGRKLHVHYWGRSGTAARYLCRGDFEAGGQHCLAFGGSTVDRRFGAEVVAALSPLGMEASLRAIARIGSEGSERRQALARQHEQLEYEAKRAFEQYDEVDPRNRLVAAELERRWNAKLAEVERVRAELAEADRAMRELTGGEEAEILALGERFGAVWESDDCPVELKKRILRTVVEEVIVDLDDVGQRLSFVIHWKGGTHTRFEMDKPRSGIGRKTSMEDLEVIRRMAVRYEDDAIARVLTKLGRRTARGLRWNRTRVETARRRNGIAGPPASTGEEEILTLGGAARHCGVSQTTIKRLVAERVIPREQLAPWAPWEIRRADLDSARVREIVERLRATGKLHLGGDHLDGQGTFFP